MVLVLAMACVPLFAPAADIDRSAVGADVAGDELKLPPRRAAGSMVKAALEVLTMVCGFSVDVEVEVGTGEETCMA